MQRLRILILSLSERIKEKMKAFISSARLQIKQQLHNKLVQFITFFQPIIYGFLMYMMYMGSGKENFVGYVILGTGMMNLWSNIVYAASTTIERERQAVTLEIINAVPTDFKTIILGKIIGNIILGVLSTFIGFIFITIAFKESLYIAHPLLFTVTVLIVIISYTIIGYSMSALFAMSRQVRYLTNLIEFPIFIFSGLIFPIEILPTWTKPISYVLSPTWGIRVLRKCIFGYERQLVFIREFLVLVLITLIYYVISRLIFAIVLKRLRVDGKLGVV